MTWPKQNALGGRIGESTSYGAVTGLSLPTNMAPNTGLNTKVPWGSEGYSRGSMSIFLQNYNGSGMIQLFARPLGVDGQPLGNGDFIPVTPVLTVQGGTDDMNLQVTWFDDTEPGNYSMIRTVAGPATVIDTGGNALNPTWATNWAMIEFRFENQSLNLQPLVAWDFLLNGDK